MIDDIIIWFRGYFEDFEEIAELMSTKLYCLLEKC